MVGILDSFNINFAGMTGTLMTTLKWTIGVILLFIIIGGIVYYAHRKKNYIYPITLLKLRKDNSIKKVHGLKGALLRNSKGIQDFKIIVPKQFKKKILGYVPDFSMAGSDDSLCFLTHGDGTIWQQVKEEIATQKIIEENGKTKQIITLLYEPIPTDVKTITLNNIHDVQALTEKSKLTAFGFYLLGIIIMIVGHLIWTYIVIKKAGA